MMALRPVHRIKHVVDGNGSLTAASQLENTLIKTKDAPVLATPQDVETGSKVNGLYLKVVVASNEATQTGVPPQVYMAIMKNPGSALAAPTINAVGVSDLKRYIIHQEMTMIQNQPNGNPTVVFNGVIKIPKGYIRNGPDDKLVMILFCPNINITFCYQAHYKEFR